MRQCKLFPKATGMISCCANPNCSVPLRRLRDGRIFQFEVKGKLAGGLSQSGGIAAAIRLSRNVSHFWLCGKCSSHHTLIFDQKTGVTVVPINP
jgi:hypothetical protein